MATSDSKHLYTLTHNNFHQTDAHLHGHETDVIILSHFLSGTYTKKRNMNIATGLL